MVSRSRYDDGSQVASSILRTSSRPAVRSAPDPMTTARWWTWVELNPETARSLGVSDDDVVRVLSPHGQLEAPVVVYPGIRPDVVAIPVGQGHGDYGRFAERRGSNPLAFNRLTHFGCNP